MLLVLIEREVMWLRKYITQYGNRKFAVFAAGLYGRRFFNWLANDYGIEAEFFIDNNPKLNGQIVCGKPILQKPWESMPEFGNDFFVLVSTKDTYYKEITQQLDEVGVPHISSDAFQVVYFWDRFKMVTSWLEDDFSKTSYLSVLWYWLTYDNSFVQTLEGQYFAVKAFAQPVKEIIVDAGAFVGDNVEEYLKRSLGSCTIYAFEPDERLIKALEIRVKRLMTEWALSNTTIAIIPMGVSNKTGSVKFVQTGNQDTHIAAQNEIGSEIKICSLDDYFKEKQPPTLIKADIEGAELDMLSGAMNIIQGNKPKLAVCIYHSIGDYVRIPEYIRGLNVKYHLAVRNHSGNYCETVLYCY
jgi:FkbM family methyltransferase